MTSERDLINQMEYREKKGRAAGIEEGVKIGKEQGKAEGIEIGKEQGIEENKLATARTMLSMDYPIEDISKITGLSVERLKSLK